MAESRENLVAYIEILVMPCAVGAAHARQVTLLAEQRRKLGKDLQVFTFAEVAHFTSALIYLIALTIDKTSDTMTIERLVEAIKRDSHLFGNHARTALKFCNETEDLLDEWRGKLETYRDWRHEHFAHIAKNPSAPFQLDQEKLNEAVTFDWIYKDMAGVIEKFSTLLTKTGHFLGDGSTLIDLGVARDTMYVFGLIDKHNKKRLEDVQRRKDDLRKRMGK